MIARMRIVLLLLSLTGPALAQPACPDAKLPVTVTDKPYVPKGVRVTVNVDLCPQTAEPPPPPEDPLHGDPAPDGLLRGDGPADLLGNRYRERVKVTPAAPG